MRQLTVLNFNWFINLVHHVWPCLRFCSTPSILIAEVFLVLVVRFFVDTSYDKIILVIPRYPGLFFSIFSTSAFVLPVFFSFCTLLGCCALNCWINQMWVNEMKMKRFPQIGIFAQTFWELWFCKNRLNRSKSLLLKNSTLVLER